VLVRLLLVLTVAFGYSAGAQQPHISAGANPGTPERPQDLRKEDREITLPPAPETFILDEAGILDETRAQKLGSYLRAQAEKESLRVYLVTTNLSQGTTPGERAVALRKAWFNDSEFGGVILYNPISRTFGFGITSTTYQALEPGTMNSISETYHATLQRLRNPSQALREIAMDFEYELRQARAGTAKRMRVMVPLRTAGTIAGISALVIAFLFLLRYASAQNYFGHAVHFPVRSVDPRLGGQHSGGHMADIDLDSRSH
jgi:hypothetical protein